MHKFLDFRLQHQTDIESQYAFANYRIHLCLAKRLNEKQIGMSISVN